MAASRPVCGRIVRAARHREEPLDDRPLAFDDFPQRDRRHKPLGAIDTGKFPSPPGPGRPLDRECIADECCRIERSLQCPRGDCLAAWLPEKWSVRAQDGYAFYRNIATVQMHRVIFAAQPRPKLVAIMLVSVEAIPAQLANRRRETARAAWCFLAGAVGSLVVWFVETITTPSYARLAYVAGLLLVCGAFALSAFYNALVNWQVRTLRLGTAREFLSTDESWWPSW
jgi:hypothetical protein